MVVVDSSKGPENLACSTSMKLRLPDLALRRWQEEALDSWASAGYRGIVAAATGTGKTLLAVHAAARAPVDRLIVVVPKRSIQDQWVRLFRTGLNFAPHRLGTIGGDRRDFQLQNHVVVAVIDSARRGLAEPIRYWHNNGDKVMLVVDECHWAGSAQSASLFEVQCDATLGLSATPERGDDGFDDLLVPNLGEVVYRYTLRHALDDGLLAPLLSYHEYFSLSFSDQHEYARLTDKVVNLRRLIGSTVGGLEAGPGWDMRLARLAETNSDAKQLKNLLRNRARLVAQSIERLKIVESIAERGQLTGRKTLVFNETVDQAERVLEVLEERGLRCELEHSRLSPASRAAALRRFASGAVDALVAVRALDEGIDVPDAEVALIVSGTLNPRQRIQRIGRVVRPNGSEAVAISILAKGTSEEHEVGARDDELLGPDRVVRHYN